MLVVKHRSRFQRTPRRSGGKADIIKEVYDEVLHGHGIPGYVVRFWSPLKEEKKGAANDEGGATTSTPLVLGYTEISKEAAMKKVHHALREKVCPRKPFKREVARLEMAIAAAREQFVNNVTTSSLAPAPADKMKRKKGTNDQRAPLPKDSKFTAAATDGSGPTPAEEGRTPEEDPAHEEEYVKKDTSTTITVLDRSIDFDEMIDDRDFLNIDPDEDIESIFSTSCSSSSFAQEDHGQSWYAQPSPAPSVFRQEGSCRGIVDSKREFPESYTASSTAPHGNRLGGTKIVTVKEDHADQQDPNDSIIFENFRTTQPVTRSGSGSGNGNTVTTTATTNLLLLVGDVNIDGGKREKYQRPHHSSSGAPSSPHWGQRMEGRSSEKDEEDGCARFRRGDSVDDPTAGSSLLLHPPSILEEDHHQHSSSSYVFQNFANHHHDIPHPHPDDFERKNFFSAHQTMKTAAPVFVLNGGDQCQQRFRTMSPSLVSACRFIDSV
mmetsp:Transcript_8340/g.24010  ORF Transcript_8340/g.24010 Transcript_8340/m.24010 type:complete len:493 (-) Transcript_8340:86-1564(-)